MLYGTKQWVRLSEIYIELNEEGKLVKVMLHLQTSQDSQGPK